MKRSLNFFLLLLLCPFLFTNCASILSSYRQKITINTNSDDAKVYVGKYFAGKGNTVTAILPKQYVGHQVRIESDKYKTEYKSIYMKKKSPLILSNLVLVFLAPIGLLYDYGPKSFLYEKQYQVDLKTSLINRKNDQKYIYLKTTSFNVEKDQIKISTAKVSSRKKAKYEPLNKEKINIDNSIFTDKLNTLLKKQGFADTTNTLLKNKLNTVYVNADVKSITFTDFIGREYAYAYYAARHLVTELTIDWEIRDIYDQVKLKKTIKSKSGEFNTGIFTPEEYFKLSVEDALTSSFLEFLKDSQTQKLIQLESGEAVTKAENIKLKKPAQPVSDVEEAVNSSVTITTKDGHGSGFFVSQDGYVVTNFHVVSSGQDIKIITNEGKTYPASVVRTNELMDLALLKTEATLEKTIVLEEGGLSSYKIGDEIYAIGTPSSTQLSQTVTKGIISGKRKMESEELIQTDAGINFGNSGGPLVNKEGKLIGVVNSKLVGFGVDGIAFAIPAKKIMQYLNLTY